MKNSHGACAENMGTLESESLTKEAQKLKQHQYRMDLERQILERKMRKVEEERQERDANAHPLGPDYAYPLPTYKSSPHRIIGTGNPQGAIPGATVLHGTAPLHKPKAEKGLLNLMKSRIHPGGDQNQGNSTSRFQMNQLQSGETMLQNDVLVQPGNGSRFPQQENHKIQSYVPSFAHHEHPRFTSDNGHLPFTYSSNPTHQMPVMYIPLYPVYCPGPPSSQPVFSSSEHVPVHSQQHSFRHQPGQSRNNQHQQSQDMNLPRLLPPPSKALQEFEEIQHDDDRVIDFSPDLAHGETDTEIEFDALKKKAHKTRKRWQTSDELPDPELTDAGYKAELRKQIAEDRKRKAEREAQEKEEDKRIERKIKEAHEEEHRRILMEQHGRAELERKRWRNKIENRKNETFVIAQQHNSTPQEEARPQSRSSLLAEKLARYGPEAKESDFSVVSSYKKPTVFYGDVDIDDYIGTNTKISPVAAIIADNVQPLRKSSPPIPVVQRKLIEDYLIGEDGAFVHHLNQRGSVARDYLFGIGAKLNSDRDFVERGLQEKVESMQQNINPLKHQWII